jgi:hypothetical protein
VQKIIYLHLLEIVHLTFNSLSLGANAYNVYCDRYPITEPRSLQYIMECTDSASPVGFGLLIAGVIALVIFCWIIYFCYMIIDALIYRCKHCTCNFRIRRTRRVQEVRQVSQIPQIQPPITVSHFFHNAYSSPFYHPNTNIIHSEVPQIGQLV